MWRRSTAPTTIISPSPASKLWRARCALRSRSTRARPTRFLRPRARSAADVPPPGRGQDTMSVYTVYEPPLKAHQSAPDPERFVFVRDGFSFWAFLLGPWWMLRHRLWLAFVCYVILAVALSIALRLIGASAAVAIIAGALFSLLVGFEAATLRRFTLSRRGWRNVGLVVGDDLESAERRFFDAWVNKGWAERSSVDGAPRASSPAMGVPMARRPSSEVIGLFPQPGAPR